MSVYFAKTFTATLTGSRVIDCACERCSTPYHYALVRQGTGTGSAPYYLFQEAAQRRAERAAADALEKRLAREREPVACPGCGWVNESNVADYRHRHHRGFTMWAWTLAITCVLVIVLSGLTRKRPLRDDEWLPTLALAGALAAAIAGGLLFTQWRLRRRFDPNRDFPTPRLPVGTPVAWRDGEAPTAAIAGAAAASAGDDRVVVFRMGTLVLPDACCECLAPATATYKAPFRVGGAHDEIAMPVCDACGPALRRRWWRIALAATAVVLWLALAAYYLLPNDPQGGRAGAIVFAALIAVFGVPVAVAFLPTWRVRPYAFRMVDPSRGLASMTFKNADYAALSREATNPDA